MPHKKLSVVLILIICVSIGILAVFFTSQQTSTSSGIRSNVVISTRDKNASIEVMYSNFDYQAKTLSDRLNKAGITDPKQRNAIAKKVSQEFDRARDEVVNSNFTKPFKPNYPDIP